MKSMRSKLAVGTLASLAVCLMMGQTAFAFPSEETISEARAGAVYATREADRQGRDVMKDPQSSDDNILELISNARATAVYATREAQRQAREVLNKTRDPGR